MTQSAEPDDPSSMDARRSWGARLFGSAPPVADADGTHGAGAGVNAGAGAGTAPLEVIDARTIGGTRLLDGLWHRL
jgi:hypothetical protein